jgi:hypothetical protein
MYCAILCPMTGFSSCASNTSNIFFCLTEPTVIMKSESLEVLSQHVSYVQRLLRTRLGRLGCPLAIFGYEKERRQDSYIFHYFIRFLACNSFCDV